MVRSSGVSILRVNTVQLGAFSLGMAQIGICLVHLYQV